MTAPATARANTLSRLTRILAPLLLYALYMGNGRAKTSRDNLPNSYLPYQIAQHGTLDDLSLGETGDEQELGADESEASF